MRSLRDSISGPRERQRSGAPPRRPSLVFAPFLIGAVVVLVVGGVLGIAWRATGVIAGAVVFVGVVRARQAIDERERRRKLADDWLLWGAAVRPSAELLSWRADELTSRRVRTSLARSLARIEREVTGAVRPGSLPLNESGLRDHSSLLHDVAARVRDLSRPVTAIGMLLVDRLLRHPWSPIYSVVPEDELVHSLQHALIALDSGAPDGPIPVFTQPTEIRLEHRAHRRSGLR
jgi:hypothetical protein